MAEKNYRTVAVVPESPRTIDAQQLHIYTPVGSINNYGVFKPDGLQFVIVNGVLRADVRNLIKLAKPAAISQVVEDGGEPAVQVGIDFTDPDDSQSREFQFQYIFKNIKGKTGATGAQGDVGLAALECFVCASGPTSLLPKVGSEQTFDISRFNRKPLFGELSTYYYQASDTGYVYLIQMMVSLVTSTTVKNNITMVSQLSGTDGENALVYSGTYTETTAGDVADEPIHLELANFSRTPVKGDTFVLVYYTTDTQQTTIALFSIYDIQDTYAEAQLVLGTQYVITGPQGKQGETGAAGTPGADGVSITSVTQTGVQGGTLVTITLSNGQSTSFTVYNGINTNFQVVDELPTENISTSTIYLISAGLVGEDNNYDEYIYVDGNWELIGSTSIDLSDYITKTYFNQNVGDATKNYVVAQIAKVHNLYIEMYESGSVPVVGQALTLTNSNFARVPVANQYFGLLEVVNTKDKYYSVCQILSVDTTTCSAKVVAVTELDNGTEIEAIKASIQALTTQLNDKADASALAGKLDKVTSTTSVRQAYVKNANGTQDMVDVYIGRVANSIVLRDGQGRAQVKAGVMDDDIVTVGQLNATQPYHITLTGYTGTVTQDQYNKLKADDRSYIYFTNDQVTVARVLSRDTGLYYNAATGVAQYRLFIRANLSYTMEVFNLELQSNKKTSITGAGNDTDYPTTGAVVDYVAANASSAYHITLDGNSGTVTKEQYDSLANDDNSYIVKSPYILRKVYADGSSLYYTCISYVTEYLITINTDYTWSYIEIGLQNSDERVISLSDSSDNVHYPSAKAVVDYVKANAGSEPYHIDIGTSAVGSITQEQFDKLEADINSYVIRDGLKLSRIGELGNNLIYQVINGLDVRKVIFYQSDLQYSTMLIRLETPGNKTNTLSSSSTTTQYPNAKATYDYGQTVLTDAKSYADSILGAEQAWLQKITTGEGV